MALLDAGGDGPLAELSALLANSSHQFLQPTPHLRQIAIDAAKAALDPLAAAIADAQARRRDENRRKRKRRAEDDDLPALQLRQIYTENFGVKQIWEQAKRVLDAAAEEIGHQLETHRGRKADQEPAQSINGGSRRHDDAESSLDGDAGEEDLYSGEDSEIGSFVDGEGEPFIEDRGEDGETDLEDIEVDSDVQMSSDDAAAKIKQKTYIQDPNGLNDGFFSIDDFNKQSQFLEQMDTRGDDDNPSDEDDVDWDADPLAMPLPQGSAAVSRLTPGKRANQQLNGQGDESEDDDDGPRFDDANLNASEDEDDELLNEDNDLGGDMGLSNANDIRYTDFFEAPPQKPSKTKRMRALPKTQPENKSASEKEDGDVLKDVERAMADVRRDLLDSENEDDLEDVDDEEELSDDNVMSKTKLPDKNMSTHEKQRAAIAAEIRRLEAANVAKRDWQLSGEVRAADRPLNSLIEEDLEFERAGKPVPVVTAETSEEIEQLIKRRILAREFDEVIRRTAAGIGNAADTRRGRIEVDDSKPQASLGEIYEQEHLKATDPASYVDKRSAATKKQHEQIDVLWREVNEQLNLLSNLNFKPRRIHIDVKTVEDKPRIAMEDARPVGEIESGEGGMLAPQEIYQPGRRAIGNQAGNNDHEILTRKSGVSANKDEMTREEKLRRRRREKERSKKAQGNKAQVVLGRTKVGGDRGGVKGGQGRNVAGSKLKEQEKADIIADLKKGGVHIVGKDGQLHNIGKTKARRHGGEQSHVESARNLKL